MPGIRVLVHVTLKITLEEPYFVLMAQLVALCSCFLVGEERRVIQGGGRGAGRGGEMGGEERRRERERRRREREGHVDACTSFLCDCSAHTSVLSLSASR